MIDEQVFDRLARLVGKLGRAFEIEPRQQQRELFAAVAGDQHRFFKRHQRQRLADRTQAGIAGDVTVTVVEQLEVIDIDHHQRKRRPQFSTALCQSRSSWRSKPRRLASPLKTVEARQFLKVLIGDLQFLLARGELGRHIVERGRERREFGDPGLLRGSRVQIAAAEARCGAHQRPDRLDHELFAAEPGQQQHEYAEHASCR